MDKTNIYPTHTCFDDTVELVAQILRVHPETLNTDEFVIAHGIVDHNGKDSSHAWIEDTHRKRVFFIGIIENKRKTLSADREEYYAELKVKEVTTYTFLDAYREEKRTGRFGPWEEKYLVLCNDKE